MKELVEFRELEDYEVTIVLDASQYQALTTWLGFINEEQLNSVYYAKLEDIRDHFNDRFSSWRADNTCES